MTLNGYLERQDRSWPSVNTRQAGSEKALVEYIMIHRRIRVHLTYVISCYTAPQPCPHIHSFCFSFCLKISPSLNFHLPAALWSTHCLIHRLCLLAALSLSFWSCSRARLWGVSDLGDLGLLSLLAFNKFTSIRSHDHWAVCDPSYPKETCA